MTQRNGKIAKLVAELLAELGQDAQREGLARTPERVEKALRYLTSGYDQDVNSILNDALFVENYDEMVVVKDIDVMSLCEHHLLPFIGKCHVAYMPKRKIVGLSKIPRLVDMFGRRLRAAWTASLHEAGSTRGTPCACAPDRGTRRASRT